MNSILQFPAQNLHFTGRARHPGLPQRASPGEVAFALRVTIVGRACEEPVRQIVLNCGTEGAVAAENIKTHASPKCGFNASMEQHEDLVKAGVIDPPRPLARRCRMRLPSPLSCSQPKP